MGIETALLIGAGVATVVGATGDIMSGIAANREAKDAAELERLNADIARAEVQEQARIKREDSAKIQATQSLMMLKSGMGLAGSPLLILEDTKRQLALDLNQLEYRSKIQDYSSSLKQNSLLKSGRAAMMGGFTKAAGRVGSFAASAYTPGSGASATSGAKSMGVNYRGSSGGLA